MTQPLGFDIEDHTVDAFTYLHHGSKIRMPPRIVFYGNPMGGKSWVRDIFERLNRTNRIFDDLPFRGLEFDHIWWNEAAEIQGQAWTQLNSKLGTKDVDMDNVWYCQDGRVMRVSDMDLDHLVNSWHLCAYMVARMRHTGASALGGLQNRNLNSATVAAFQHVTPSDVFPLYDEICVTARAKFFEKYNCHIDELKILVFDAWSRGCKIPSTYAPAIRFMLRSHDEIGYGHNRRRVVHDKIKLELMLGLAKVQSDEQLQRLAWNLRIDQKALWEQIANEPNLHRKIVRVPENRKNSAFNFLPDDHNWHFNTEFDDDLPFGLDIPFGAGR